MTSHVVLVAMKGQFIVCNNVYYRQTALMIGHGQAGQITTPREDRYMMTLSHCQCFIPATKKLQRLRQATRTRLSVYTDRNRLRVARLRAQRPYRCFSYVTKSHAWIGCNNINTFERSSRSSDLSPMVHICVHLGRRLRERNDVNIVNDLERTLHEE